MPFGLRRFVRPLWFPLTLLLVGSAATVFVTHELREAFQAQDAERFAAAADQLQDRINERLDTYIAMLRAGAGLAAASSNLTLRDFRAFTGQLELERRYPGIQGIGLSVRIAPGDLRQAVAARRRDGDPGFRVWPEEPREEYHAIVYLEPLDRRNLAAIGYDMFTDPTRRAAMERARDMGEPAASGAVTLVQEIDDEKQPGFLIYMPVYEGGSIPAAIEQRRARLWGFVYSPFRAGDLFTGILGRNPRPGAGFELFDGAPGEGTRLHATGELPPSPRFTETRTISVAGRLWTARMFSLPALEQGSNVGWVPFVGWGGAIITVLLTALAWNQTRARERAEESEAVAAGASRSLQAQTATLEIINRTGVQLAGELDFDRLLQAVTDAATRLSRAQFGAFFYNTANPAGEAYTLYTVSGAPREAFENTAVPRNAAGFGPAFGREGIVRSADVTADAEHGGNPPVTVIFPGHLRVRSYLAVPVRSRSGEVLGGLFFGHSDRAVFSEQAEHIVAGIAAQAAVAIDNARLYGEVQRLLASERTARAEAERVSSLKDEFLATLSHELRTPLNAVIGWAHMLSGGRLAEDKRRLAADAILRNARAQSHLVEDLLDMSRIISGRLHMNMGDVSLRDVLHAAADVVHPMADAKRVQLVLHLDDPVDHVRGDADRLQQVAWNLLTNAIKFTPPGGRVDVGLYDRGDRVEFSVSDTGIGIDTHFLPYVFERFRQADGSFTRGHGGLGLGLSIVRSLVEMHAGEVHASSEGPDRGATFTVSLPRLASTTRTLRGGEPKTVAPLAAAGDALRGLSVLVVDDDHDGLDLACEVLEQHGADVRTASSGIQALRLLQSSSQAIDLLICDLGMPQMDGYELMRRVRALPVEAGSTARAIALTAYAGVSDQRRALAAGFDLHVAKPFTPEQLVAACLSLAPRSTA